MPDQKMSSRPAAEIITPLRPLAAGKTAEPQTNRKGLKIMALTAALLLMAGGGAWVLHQLAEKPAATPAAAGSLVPVKSMAEEQRAAQVKGRIPQAPPAEALVQVKEDLPKNGEQKTAASRQGFDQLVVSARQHERAGDLTAALADRRQVEKIKTDDRQVRRELQRVPHLLAERRFERLMSEGLAAMHASDYRGARAKLSEARRMKPASRAAADALFEVEQALRLERIAKLEGQGRAAEKAEDWQRALQAYTAVLKIDAGIQFALQGKARALKHRRLLKGLDFFLASPQVLESDSQLRRALLLIAEVEASASRGPQLNARLARLQQLVQAAQTRVRVVIESDNLTQVAVYRVGRLGRFAVRELQLRPGTYTLVGSRDGYQDVRRMIVVKADQPGVHVRIVCKVKI